MAYQKIQVELMRDGQMTPWGIRMTGGADLGTPLVIQKVSLGSPSEGELHKGDVILRIRDTEASRLSHQAATDIISKAGTTLTLVVARRDDPSRLIANTPNAILAQQLRPLLTPALPSGNVFIFKPLPTTQMGVRQRRISSESFTSTSSCDTEKECITNQPYRSIPLILPAAKSSKDIPTGSYLRFDPLLRTSTPPNVGFRQHDPYMFNKVHEALSEATQSCSSGVSSPGYHSPTPELVNSNGTAMFLRQYNTPINMYSNQAIVEALAAQTVHMKHPFLDSADLLENKRLTNITQSPTYQLIQDEEWKRGNIEEHGPLEERVYNVNPGSKTRFKPNIHQSQSLKCLMNDLRGISEF